MIWQLAANKINNRCRPNEKNIILNKMSCDHVMYWADTSDAICNGCSPCALAIRHAHSYGGTFGASMPHTFIRKSDELRLPLKTVDRFKRHTDNTQPVKSQFMPCKRDLINLASNDQKPLRKMNISSRSWHYLIILSSNQQDLLLKISTKIYKSVKLTGLEITSTRNGVAYLWLLLS